MVQSSTPKQSPPSPQDPTRADVVNAVLKSKNIRNIDDLDEEEGAPPLLRLQAHHDLVFIVELCEATRPSKLGSLKGSHEKYEDEYSRLQQMLDDALRGEGSCSFHKWKQGMGDLSVVGGGGAPARASPGGPAGARPTRPQSAASTRPSRPQSAMSTISRNARLPGYGGAEPEQVAPRIGAFEVSFKLVNTQSHKVYGPDLLFSKIESGHWPGGATQLVNRAQKSLQPWLMADTGSHSIHAYAKAEAAKANASPTHAATGAALPPHVCLASSLDEESEDMPAAVPARSSGDPDYAANYATSAPADSGGDGSVVASSQPGHGGSSERREPPRSAAPVTSAPAAAAAAAADYDLATDGETEAEAAALEAALEAA